jgi:cell wall-associated NlpC family hydrolase
MRPMKRFQVLAVLTLVSSAALSGASETATLLGKLGQATSRSQIHASPNSRSRVYYTVEPYEYLVVAPAKERGWAKVLMVNGIYAYVPSKNVAQLPYNIVSKSGQTYTAREGTGRIVGNQTSRGAVADHALNFQGTKYVWGGNDLQNGIDCSGFVKQLYGGIGVSLPRTAAEQAMVGQPVKKLEDLKKGDRLYFWDKKRGKVGHTGIYLGNGYFVHSSSGKGGVTTDYLGAAKWRNILVAARR